MEPVVLKKEALGFICNRLQMALYREVANLVMSGVSAPSRMQTRPSRSAQASVGASWDRR